MEELLAKINELSLEEKQSLHIILGKLIDTDTLTLQKDNTVKHHLDTMKIFAGNDFLDGGTREKTTARVVVSVCLREAGFNKSQIGKILNKNHATVIHYLKIWKDALRLPRIYRDTIELYKKYKDAL